MNKEQAFDLIVQVTGEFKGNRQDHAMITQALEILRQEVFSKLPEVSEFPKVHEE